MCSNTDDCVEDADCLPMMKGPEQNAAGPTKVCKCKEDLYPYDNECNSKLQQNCITYAMFKSNIRIGKQRKHNKLESGHDIDLF